MVGNLFYLALEPKLRDGTAHLRLLGAQLCARLIRTSRNSAGLQLALYAP